MSSVVRAFGTQLLCEQVIGRSLRRQSYELNDGEPLRRRVRRRVRRARSTSPPSPVVAPPQPPRRNGAGQGALAGARTTREIRFPRDGRATESNCRTTASRRTSFTEDSDARAHAGDSWVRRSRTIEGIIGEGHVSHSALKALGERSPVHGPLRTHQDGCSSRAIGAIANERAESCTCSAS